MARSRDNQTFVESEISFSDHKVAAPRTEMRSGEQVTRMELTGGLLATAALMLQPYVLSCSAILLFCSIRPKGGLGKGGI